MPKRIADKRLTDQNWDQEDNDEIPEQFVSKQADESVLKTRVIRKARRRMPIDPSAQSQAGKVFSSVKSFTSIQNSSNNTFKLPTSDAKSFLSTSSTSFSLARSSSMPAQKSLPGSTSSQISKPFSFGSTTSEASKTPLFASPPETSKLLLSPATESSTPVTFASPATESSKPVDFGSQDSKAFKPLSIASSASQASKPFGFGVGTSTANASTVKNNNSLFESSNSKTDNSFSKNIFGSEAGSKDQSSAESNSAVSESRKEEDDGDDIEEYNRHLSALNRSVSEWISQHVNENPLVDLAPVFNDYNKHMATIEEKYNKSKTVITPQSSDKSAPKQEEKKEVKEEAKEEAKEEETKIATSSSKIQTPAKNPLGGLMTSSSSSMSGGFQGFQGFQGFGNKSSPATLPVFKGFTGFGKNPLTGGASSNLSFKPKSDEGGDAKADNEDEPPKVESVQIEEEGATYSKKCKLYYMKDDKYNDKGVGFMHLKPVGDKTQMIVRADNAIGTILLNVVINPQMPAASKQGKNMVRYPCVANPSIDGIPADKIVTFLMRVKTSEDADEMVSTINKHR